MTLDEAIKHAEEVAEEKEKLANTYESFKDYGNPKSSITSGHKKCLNCAKEHRQLAEWLKDYKRLLEQEPCETIKEIPKDYKYDTETEDFLVYRHMYTGHEIHIEKPVPRYKLEQEPFMYKPCVAHQVCHEDKVKALDKIRVEIEKQEKWLLRAGYTACNMDIAFDAIKAVIAESEGRK